MNLREQLLAAHSRVNADLIIDHLSERPERFPEMMDILLGTERPCIQRAAMVIGDLGRKYPEWLRPYHARLVTAAGTPPHPAVRRNVLRYFSELPTGDIEEDAEGPVLELAFRVLQTPAEPVAIRIYGMQIVFNFCDRFPELRGELRDSIESELREATPGFRSRGRKILRALNKGWQVS